MKIDMFDNRNTIDMDPSSDPLGYKSLLEQRARNRQDQAIAQEDDPLRNFWLRFNATRSNVMSRPGDIALNEAFDVTQGKNGPAKGGVREGGSFGAGLAGMGQGLDSWLTNPNVPGGPSYSNLGAIMGGLQQGVSGKSRNAGRLKQILAAHQDPFSLG